ncbi:macro domain-containing protein [bacterium]|nr:macro domain-containing protein [bacterium]MBU1991319.1 macro domain-containing protein [bacterium]
MKFKLKYGNLIKEEATFIVNASNTELILGSGVSQAFYEHCGGAEYQKELFDLKKKAGILQQGDVVLSGPGSASNFQYALHVAVMNYSDTAQSQYPTYMQIQNALHNIVSIAETKIREEKIENARVVMPLLGCGVGGLKKEKVFLMIKSIFKKSKVDFDLILCFHNKKDYYEFSVKESD